MGRWLSDVPVLGEAEAMAGTAATGTVDTLIADPGNALLGVNADNMGLFEENAAGAKTMNLATLGLGGEGGLLSDVLMPGQGAPGERQPANQSGDSSDDNRDDQGLPVTTLALAGLGAALLFVVVS